MASQVENSSQLLFPKSSFPILQQRKCNKHPNRQLTFLYTNPADSESSVFKCEECLIEQGLESQYLILLSSIYNSDDKTVFLNWPIPGDKEITDKIKALLNDPKEERNLEALEGDVDRFFKDLSKVVFDKIEKMHEQMKKKVQDFRDQNKQIIDQYNKFSKKNELKEAVQDKHTSTLALSQKIKSEMAFVLTNEEYIKQTLTSELEEILYHENSIDFEGLTIAKNNILAALDSITIFPEQNECSKNQDIFTCIKELNPEQLTNLTLLGLKMNELSDKLCEADSQEKVLKKEQQENSYGICQLLRKYKELSQQKIDDLENLLMKYPVFELAEELFDTDIQQLAILDDNKPISWKWRLSILKEQQKLLLSTTINGVSIIQKKSIFGQAVTQHVLKKNHVYSFKCKFNKPLNRCCCIRIGLIKNEQINGYKLGFKDDLCFESNTNRSKEIVKGEFLNSESLSKSLTKIHFKVCIQTQTFLFSDETHENINKVTQQINPEGQYRVGIIFLAPGDGYSCEFFDVRVSSDLTQANYF